MYFLMTIVILAQIYAIVSIALNYLLGIAGRFSAYEAALMGVGAYTAALLARDAGLDLIVGCIAGSIFCALIGVVFQIATRHMDFFTFKITSFALQMTLWQTFMTWRSLTNGADGLHSIPRPEIFGVSFRDLGSYFLLTTTLTLIIVGYLLYFGRSQFALALRGLRDGEKALESLGKDTFILKLKVFAISAAATGFAGGLLAGMLRSINPLSFYIYVSVIFIIFVTAGGLGNLWGTLVAVVGLTAAQELIKMIPGLPTTYIAPLQQIFFGLVLIAVMMLRPKGLLPEVPLFRKPSVRSSEPASSGFALLDEPRVKTP